MGNSQLEKEEKKPLKLFKKENKKEKINYFNFLERNPYTPNK